MGKPTGFIEWTRLVAPRRPLADRTRDWAEVEKFDLASAPPSMVIEEFQVALMAVLAHQGLGLLPEILVRDRIRKGELVTFSQGRVKTDYNFHIVHAPNAHRRPLVPEVIAWLKSEAAG